MVESSKKVLSNLQGSRGNRKIEVSVYGEVGKEAAVVEISS